MFICNQSPVSKNLELKNDSSIIFTNYPNYNDSMSVIWQSFVTRFDKLSNLHTTIYDLLYNELINMEN